MIQIDQAKIKNAFERLYAGIRPFSAQAGEALQDLTAIVDEFLVGIATAVEVAPSHPIISAPPTDTTAV